MTEGNNPRLPRYPNMGKLSVTILEEYVKRVIGESAIDELKAPLQQKILSDSLVKALTHAEERFITEYCKEDKELSESIIQLPIADLPKFQLAILGFAEHPENPGFRVLLINQLKQDYPNISDERIEKVVEVYLNILRQELVMISKEIREKLMALTLFDIDEQLKQVTINILEFIKRLSREQENSVTKGNLPPLPQLVIGRERDVEELKRMIIPNNGQGKGTTVLTAIRGWPGVGKTTIASVIAHDPELSAAYPDGVLWCSLGQHPNILSELAAWGRALGTDEILKAQNIREAQNKLSALLRNRRMLLLLDDVWESEHAVSFNVGGQGCATLITTRLNDVARALSPNPENIYFLPVLTEDSAMELMKILAPLVVEQYPDEMILLVHELEGLPLALQVAGRVLQTEASVRFGVKELISELHESARLLEEKAPPDRADLVNETTPKIAALLQKSTDILDEFTRDCYAFLGVFAPKPATLDLNAMAFVWKVEDPKPIVRKLIDHGLLEYIFELDRFQMHALLVMHAKSLLNYE